MKQIQVNIRTSSSKKKNHSLKMEQFYFFECMIFFLLKVLPYTRHVTDAGLAKETDMYFMAVIERGTGKANHSQLS